jgi:DNA repair exonuclease SbcCD nuclease subunit
MAVSFIHTADWQIGKVFSAIGGDAAVLLKTQRVKTVQRIAQLATERHLDAVLVAGDVFENNLVSNETIHALVHAMAGFTGPWVLIPGNHDPAVAESVWQRMETLGCPNNVYIALEPKPITLADGRLAVLPASLRRRHEIEDLTAAWDAAATPDGVVRVGLAHGSVEGHLPGASEATNPIAADRETRARLEYLALGDWHGTYKVSNRIWYSGTPEPDRFKDNDPGNVLVVTVSGPGAEPVIEHVRSAHYVWTEVEAALTDVNDLAGLEARFASLVEPLEQHVLMLTISGTIDFSTREQMDRILSKWRGRLTWLGADCSRLLAQPTEADLDRIDIAGFVRTAMERLRAVHADPSDPNREFAIEALRLLYQIHTAEAEHT